MLIDGETYAPSMVRFLNQFSRKCKSQSPEQNKYLADLLDSFLKACEKLPEDAFLNKRNKRFNVALFEAAFAAVCTAAFKENRLIKTPLTAARLSELEGDGEFLGATIEGTTQTRNVKARLKRARAILGSVH
jgi:hypothetical protein